MAVKLVEEERWGAMKPVDNHVVFSYLYAFDAFQMSSSLHIL